METLSYSFDANGNQLTMGNSNGTYTLTYDALNRVTVAKDMWGDTLTFTYDAVGNRSKVQDSQGGTTTSLYDAASNLVTRLYSASGANPLRIDLTYNAVNQIQTETRYSDLTGTTNVAYSTFTYDVINRVSNLQHRKGSDNSNIANYTYTYDAGGRLTTEVLNGATKTYTYDTTSQLTADGTNTFTYDGTGNRNNGSWTTGTDNRLSSDGTWTYTYNDEGDLSKKSKGASLETWTYGYDGKNELVWVEKRATDGGTLQQRVDYKYDALGNRIQKAIDNNGDGLVDTTQRYAYDGWKSGPQKSFVGNENWDVWVDLDGSNSLTTRYMRGNVVDQVFAGIDSGTPYWNLPDRLGSVRDMVDNASVIKDTLAYDGFGNITSETNSVFRGRYAWTGRELDTETNLTYNRARYYDSGAGRWLRQDPRSFDAGDTNLYRYVRNVTTALIDPSGLAETSLMFPQAKPSKPSDTLVLPPLVVKPSPNPGEAIPYLPPIVVPPSKPGQSLQILPNLPAKPLDIKPPFGGPAIPIPGGASIGFNPTPSLFQRPFENIYIAGEQKTDDLSKINPYLPAKPGAVTFLWQLGQYQASGYVGDKNNPSIVGNAVHKPGSSQFSLGAPAGGPIPFNWSYSAVQEQGKPDVHNVGIMQTIKFDKNSSFLGLRPGPSAFGLGGNVSKIGPHYVPSITLIGQSPTYGFSVQYVHGLGIRFGVEFAR